MGRASLAKTTRRNNILKAVGHKKNNITSNVKSTVHVTKNNDDHADDKMYTIKKAREALKAKREKENQRKTFKRTQIKLMSNIKQKQVINQINLSSNQQKPPTQVMNREFADLSQYGKRYRLQKLNEVIQTNLGGNFCLIERNKGTPREGLKLLLLNNLSLRSYEAVAKASLRTFFLF